MIKFLLVCGLLAVAIIFLAPQIQAMFPGSTAGIQADVDRIGTQIGEQTNDARDSFTEAVESATNDARDSLTEAVESATNTVTDVMP